MKEWFQVFLIMLALAAGVYFIADGENRFLLAGMVIIWPILIAIFAWIYSKFFNL